MFEYQRIPSPASCEYLCGLDLGQLADYTALVMVRQIRMGYNDLGSEVNMFEVPHIERFPLGSSYPNIVQSVVNLMRRPEINPPKRPRPGGSQDGPPGFHVDGKPTLIVDATGVGRAVVDMFRAAGLRDLQAVTITSGLSETPQAYGEWRVAKAHLVSAAQAVLSSGLLKIGRNIPHADIMMKELADFRVKVSEHGRESWNAREGTHDDLVLALCLPVWFAGLWHSAGAY
jgi:hypothetical protein